MADQDPGELKTVGSMFSGIGGWDLAARKCGLTTRWVAEKDPFRRLILETHFPGVHQYSDVAAIGPDADPVDILCASFPCQDVSTARHASKSKNSKHGVNGERSGLFREVIRVARLHRPRYIVMENVPGLLHSGFEHVLCELAESGFDAEWDCVSASAIGAPHVRDRIWIVAYPDSLLHYGEPDQALGPGLRERIDGLRASAGSRWGTDTFPPGVVDELPSWMDRCTSLGDSLVPAIGEQVLRQVVAFDQRVRAQASGERSPA